MTLNQQDVQEAANEGTHLLLDADLPPHLVKLRSTKNALVKSNSCDNAFNILLSTTLSRFGSRAWEFATPLLLLEWSPESLAAPASLGLACSLFRMIVSPTLGKMADEWDRLSTVWIGTSMQAVGCLMSIGALLLFNFNAATSKTHNADVNDDGDLSLLRLLSYVLVITAGVIEALGAQLASVAVKKEWLPIVFDEEITASSITEAADKKKSKIFSFVDIRSPTISFMNTTMTNIDLLAAMLGPLLAGWVLQALAFKDNSMQKGFVLVAVVNVVSFVPEIYLLRKVYLSCYALQIRTRDITTDASDQMHGKLENTSRSHDSHNEDDRNPWILWINHPSGLPLLTISLASLYMTALSPAGVVLTSYLMTIGMSPSSIGVFRGIGAISGVVGISCFSLLRQERDANDEGEQSAPEQSSLVRSIERLRSLSLAFLMLEVASVLVASAAYALCDTTSIGSSWQLNIFLGAIVVSRAGLYSFDVGVLEIEQYIVDERYRNAIGSVEGALCSLCEVGMYILSIILPKPAQFGWQVGVSATAVSFGGACFGLFLSLYHMHLHHHHEDKHHRDHSHSHAHHHHHRHTMQQERDLKEYGYHIHLHRHGKSWV